ncbi:MAG: helix-turn-helix transcriptional regulator [Lachnospiraceae bacterium]|nr:helix-turn-helix transcriptional regulator [Lachnospiraceae bacterium]
MFNIISVDVRSRHGGDFIYDFSNGFDTWLLLLVHTRSVFRIDGEDRVFPADSLVLFKPEMPIYYRACGDLYSDDWLHFRCSENDINETLVPLGLPIRTPLPEQCRELFHLLTVENYLDNEYKNHTVNALIHALIHKLIEAYHLSATSQKHSDLMELRKEIYKYPGEKWTLATMAAKVFLSESHLQSMYKKTFNVSCINDVINARIQLAKSLLSYTDYTISYISKSCGYNSSQHFFRQFNKMAGCSPNEYRKSFRM